MHFLNKVDLFKDFAQKLILTVLPNLFRTLRTYCIPIVVTYTYCSNEYGVINEMFIIVY
jgi:hypothetical protein